jgi:hypothetical protein
VSSTELNLASRPMIVWFAALVGLGLWSRSDLAERRAGRCSLDGIALTPTARVDLVQGDEELARFCCTTCAASWPDVPDGAWWRVRDETTGERLVSTEAIFVTSRVVTVSARHDRVHAFAQLRDAMAHAAAFGGRVIPCPLPTIDARSFEGVGPPMLDLRAPSPDGKR